MSFATVTFGLGVGLLGGVAVVLLVEKVRAFRNRSGRRRRGDGKVRLP